LALRPFVLNRDVTDHDIVIERYAEGGYVLIDVSEYDGMLEQVGVKPLNRMTATKAIQSWERDLDYITENEYDVIFRITYRRSPNAYSNLRGKEVYVNYHFSQSNNATVADWEGVEEQIAKILHHLNEPLTEVTMLEIQGPTAHKMWYRVSTEIVDFTPV